INFSVANDEFDPVRKTRHFVHPVRVGDQSAHTRVLYDVLDVGLLEPRQDWNYDSIGEENAKDDRYLVEGLLHADADAVARLHANLMQTFRRRQRFLIKLRKGCRSRPADNGKFI